MNVKEQTFKFQLLHQNLFLLPGKAIFWEEEKTLICADLHLGKVGHFRKEGIRVPKDAGRQTIKKLKSLITRWNPQRVLFLGDLFHSDYNLEWVGLNDLMDEFINVEFILVLGNHDILETDIYQKTRMHVLQSPQVYEPFIMSHEPLDVHHKGLYNLCGHIHPAVRMRGKARQAIRLPCFYFGDHTCILPAFGVFTGMAIIQPQKGEKVFVIAGENVIAV
ncbi:MAG: ligase-associated DNA damage response endonuclease PdeM [Saprospiraceae bacterium]|nr:ligase-associated DNA damage response endonuclease PdeM [Saprospiraceae bacterium]